MYVWVIIWDQNKAIDIGEWSIWEGSRLERFYCSSVGKAAILAWFVGALHPSNSLGHISEQRGQKERGTEVERGRNREGRKRDRNRSNQRGRETGKERQKDKHLERQTERQR